MRASARRAWGGRGFTRSVDFRGFPRISEDLLQGIDEVRLGRAGGGLAFPALRRRPFLMGWVPPTSFFVNYRSWPLQFELK